MDEINSTRNRERKDRWIPIAIVTLGILIAGVLLVDLSDPIVLEESVISPSVVCTQGKTLIVRKKVVPLSTGGSGTLEIWDRVRTLSDSMATIFWPDGSVTRLGEKSSVLIHEMSSERSGVRIDFSLEGGRSWSNVITPIFSGSHFRERYDNDSTIATVRGTVFEVDLDRSYIRTVEHAVEVLWWENSGGILSAGSIAHIKSGKILPDTIVDTAWERLNQSADIAYANERLERFNREVLEKFGKKNYFRELLEFLGLRRHDPMSRIFQSDYQDQKEALAPADLDRARTLYAQIGNIEHNEKVEQIKDRLEQLLIANTSAEEKQELIDNFARRNLYRLWKLSTENTPSEHILKLREKTAEYLQMGADRSTLERLEHSFRTKSLDRIEESVKNAGEAMWRKNYFDEIIPPLDPKRIDTINDRATQIRENFWETIRAFFWP